MTGNKQNVELQGKEVWLEDFLNELADPAAPLIFEQVHAWTLRASGRKAQRSNCEFILFLNQKGQP